MKIAPLRSFETNTALESLSNGLRRSRLLRKETQQLAAERCGTSLATYKRLESADPDKIAGISIAIVFEALCAYGHAGDVLNLGDPSRDAQAAHLIARAIPKRGRNKKIG